MLLYKYNFCLANNEGCNDSRKEMNFRAKAINCATERFNSTLTGIGAVAVSYLEDGELQCTLALKKMKPAMADKLVEDFLAELKYENSIISKEELTSQEFRNLLIQAYRNDFIDDDDEYIEQLGLASIEMIKRRHVFCETLLNTTYTWNEAQQLSREMLIAEAVKPELKRIYSSKSTEFHGHPVHYIISASSEDAVQGIRGLLLGALYGTGRLVGRRCCILEFKPDAPIDVEEVESLYSALAGGTVVFSIKPERINSNYADPSIETLPMIARLAKKYRRDVLTIIGCKKQNQKQINMITEELFGVAVVHITEDTIFRKEAEAYLRRKAKEIGAKRFTQLYMLLGSGEKGFVRSELDSIFDGWYDNYLRSDLYPQYRAVNKVDTHEVTYAHGSAIDELNAMIGLTGAKQLITEAIAFKKAQKLFAEKGFIAQPPSMHMVFTGNPGTAKTTVARLFAQIMKDNDLLPVGRLIEVGRADLVGKYLGWTAQIVRDKFKAARGSVLFIDEAYSLVDDRGGLYGDEAINTIVQEMENARNDTLVIFAGYPKKMKEFLERNPGLKSRIAHHVEFPDYSLDELMDIFKHILKKSNKEAEEDACCKVRKILSEVQTSTDFGNGRFVRTLVEKAIIRQATRLMHLDASLVTKELIATLKADDFEYCPIFENRAKRIIGY